MRYGVLLVGGACLYLFVGPVRIRPTLSGRLTGVLMSALVGFLMLLHVLGSRWSDTLRDADAERDPGSCRERPCCRRWRWAGTTCGSCAAPCRRRDASSGTCAGARGERGRAGARGRSLPLLRDRRAAVPQAGGGDRAARVRGAAASSIEIGFDRGRPTDGRCSGRSVRLGDVLVHRGVVSESTLAQALADQRAGSGVRLGALLRASHGVRGRGRRERGRRRVPAPRVRAGAVARGSLPFPPLTPMPRRTPRPTTSCSTSSWTGSSSRAAPRRPDIGRDVIRVERAVAGARRKPRGSGPPPLAPALGG